MSQPHGGTLVNRTIASPEAERELREEAKSLRGFTLTGRELNDLALIANGACSPLTGFMTRADYESVVPTMRLANGLPWSIPVVLAVDREEAPTIGSRAALYDAEGALRAVIDVEDVFEYDKRKKRSTCTVPKTRSIPAWPRCTSANRCSSAAPCGCCRVKQDPDSLTPAQTRAEFERRGWKTIVAFQTRNPIHRAHEYIQKCALEIVDGLLLHPLVGETKGDDIPADVRMRCYEALLDNYYPTRPRAAGTLPAAMRYAGPREAIFHAIMRKNYGCTHFIVGRDHAGVGSYYGTYDAQKIFDEFTIEELGITPLNFENTFYCRRCQSMGTEKTCPHDPENHVSLQRHGRPRDATRRRVAAAGVLPARGCGGPHRSLARSRLSLAQPCHPSGAPEGRGVEGQQKRSQLGSVFPCKARGS